MWTFLRCVRFSVRKWRFYEQPTRTVDKRKHLLGLVRSRSWFLRDQTSGQSHRIPKENGRSRILRRWVNLSDKKQRRWIMASTSTAHSLRNLDRHGQGEWDMWSQILFRWESRERERGTSLRRWRRKERRKEGWNNSSFAHWPKF